MPSSAELARRRPSKANGRVTTPMVSAPSERAMARARYLAREGRIADAERAYRDVLAEHLPERLDELTLRLEVTEPPCQPSPPR